MIQLLDINNKKCKFTILKTKQNWNSTRSKDSWPKALERGQKENFPTACFRPNTAKADCPKFLGISFFLVKSGSKIWVMIARCTKLMTEL